MAAKDIDSVNDLAIIVGKNIRRIRLQHGLTQKELAKLIKTDAKMISQYEHGAIPMAIDRLGNIAKVLDVDISELTH